MILFKKVDDLTCTTEVIFRREKTVPMDKEACNFILLVILLEKMMRVAKMCYWMRLILPPKVWGFCLKFRRFIEHNFRQKFPIISFSLYHS